MLEGTEMAARRNWALSTNSSLRRKPGNRAIARFHKIHSFLPRNQLFERCISCHLALPSRLDSHRGGKERTTTTNYELLVTLSESHHLLRRIPHRVRGREVQ